MTIQLATFVDIYLASPYRPLDGLSADAVLSRSQPNRRAVEDDQKDATHFRYPRVFADFVTQFTATLQRYAGLPGELIAVAGEYRYFRHPGA
jgi:hypothetical protein